MNNNPKSTKDAPPEPARDAPPTSETAPFTAFATLFHQGVERFAELQKHTLDLVASQTNDAIGAWKQAVPMPTSTPGAMMLDLAGQGVEKVVQARKSLIDLVVQQSARGVEM